MSEIDPHSTVAETFGTDAIGWLEIPWAAADTLGETLQVFAPKDWHDRIITLAERCQYGPRYSRAIAEHVRDLSDTVRCGYSVAAYDHLLAAERYNAGDRNAQR